MTRAGEAGAWLNLFSFYENWIEFLCENFAAIPKLFNEINFCLIFKLRIKYIPVLEYFQTSFMKNISDLLPRYGEQWILSNQTWSKLKLKQSERVMLLRRLFSRTLLPRTSGSRKASSSSSEVARFLSEETVSRKNGLKEKRLYSDSEYERRLSNLR